MSNVDSSVMSTGLKISHTTVQIYLMLSFLKQKTCLYNKTPQHHDSSSSELIMKFLELRELGKLHNNSETTK